MLIMTYGKIIPDLVIDDNIVKTIVVIPTMTALNQNVDLT